MTRSQDLEPEEEKWSSWRFEELSVEAGGAEHAASADTRAPYGIVAYYVFFSFLIRSINHIMCVRHTVGGGNSPKEW